MPQSFRISDFIAPSNVMQVVVSISDKPGTGNILEGGFDRFEITDVPLGLNESENGGFIAVFPNPAKDILYLNQQAYSSLADNVSVEILDLRGRIVESVSLNSNSIDISNIESGVYFIKIYHGGNTAGYSRFIKQ